MWIQASQGHFDVNGISHQIVIEWGCMYVFTEGEDDDDDEREGVVNRRNQQKGNGKRRRRNQRGNRRNRNNQNARPIQIQQNNLQQDNDIQNPIEIPPENQIQNNQNNYVWVNRMVEIAIIILEAMTRITQTLVNFLREVRQNNA